METALSLDIEKALKILKEDGLLSCSLKGFEPREQQQKMMGDILKAYNDNSIALIEAGTGTGKSFAYLIPAILWAAQNKERTVISTHTIALQEQLMIKDIPIILKALGVELKAALIKGMGNYLCLRKLQEANDERLLLDPPRAEELQKIDGWNQSGKDGSRSSLPFAVSHEMWGMVAAESDTCTNSKCQYFQECHFFKARRKANDAQILIVNHHLLFADLNRRAENENYNDAAILPHYTRVILDEAHHIEDIATEYFATNINRMNLLRIIGRLSAEKQVNAHGKLPLLKQKIVDYYKSKTISSEVTSILSRLNIDLTGNKNDLLTHIVRTFDALSHFVTSIGTNNSSREDKENKLRLLPYHQTHPIWQNEIVPNVQDLLKAISQYARSIESIDQDVKAMEDEKLDEITKTVRYEVLALSNRLKESGDAFSEFISDKVDPNKVRWIELQASHLDNIHLNNANLDISMSCVEYLFNKFSTVILCSATLTSNQKFQFIRQRLGLTSKLLPDQTITENVYDSPFNFAKQAMLVVPTDIPNPMDPNFIQVASEKIWGIIQASHGNAFILFTSYSMLNTCYNYLEKKLLSHRYTPLKQGVESRQKLIQKFKDQDRSVLFGTDSFWEGVDVSGDALRCVVMVKLPFKVPSEPIIQARSEALHANGQDSFMEYSLPTAIVKFKQGFGRLIRNKKDRGCIVCLDSRILQKGYGKHFLNSLPNCQQFFGPSDLMEKQMVDFYKKTYHLVKK